jgi:hypothetical protein
MLFGSVAAASARAALRFAGFRTVGLEVLAALRAGIVISSTSEGSRPDDIEFSGEKEGAQRLTTRPLQ